jgi:hypothetical protein
VGGLLPTVVADQYIPLTSARQQPPYMPAHQALPCVFHCHEPVAATVAGGDEVCHSAALKECLIAHGGVQLLGEAPHLTQALQIRTDMMRMLRVQLCYIERLEQHARRVQVQLSGEAPHLTQALQWEDI